MAKARPHAVAAQAVVASAPVLAPSVLDGATSGPPEGSSEPAQVRAPKKKRLVRKAKGHKVPAESQTVAGSGGTAADAAGSVPHGEVHTADVAVEDKVPAAGWDAAGADPQQQWEGASAGWSAGGTAMSASPGAAHDWRANLATKVLSLVRWGGNRWQMLDKRDNVEHEGAVCWCYLQDLAEDIGLTDEVELVSELASVLAASAPYIRLRVLVEVGQGALRVLVGAGRSDQRCRNHTEWAWFSRPTVVGQGLEFKISFTDLVQIIDMYVRVPESPPSLWIWGDSSDLASVRFGPRKHVPPPDSGLRGIWVEDWNVEADPTVLSLPVARRLRATETFPAAWSRQQADADHSAEFVPLSGGTPPAVGPAADGAGNAPALPPHVPLGVATSQEATRSGLSEWASAWLQSPSPGRKRAWSEAASAAATAAWNSPGRTPPASKPHSPGAGSGTGHGEAFEAVGAAAISAPAVVPTGAASGSSAAAAAPEMAAAGTDGRLVGARSKSKHGHKHKKDKVRKETKEMAHAHKEKKHKGSDKAAGKDKAKKDSHTLLVQ